MKPDKKEISIIDATLREGQQAPLVSFSIKQSVAIAKGLKLAGVNAIECSHAAISQYEVKKIQAVSAAVPDVEILTHARAHKKDILAAVESGADWVGMFVGINRVSQKHRLRRSYKDILCMIEDNVLLAKKNNLKVRCTIEDSGRSQLTQLFDAYTLALEAGADRICYSDTVGQLDPEKVSKTIAGLREKFPFVDIEVHFHNDRGLALANALAAIKAGANWVSTSVNGLGERCGIVDLSLLYANLIYIGKKRVKNPSLLHRLSETVAAYSRTTVSQMAPVVGLSAFSHTAKLHRNAVLENEAAYSWICPSSLGRRVTLQNVEGNPRTEELVSSPRIITATELKHHRHGPGDRYVMIDERFVPNCRQYCIVREVPDMEDYGAGHVDSHAHKVDSLYMFIGKETN